MENLYCLSSKMEVLLVSYSVWAFFVFARYLLFLRKGRGTPHSFPLIFTKKGVFRSVPDKKE